MGSPLSEVAQGRDARSGWSAVTIDRVRIPWAFPLVLAAAAVTTVGLLYLTRRFDFFYDEWDYVLGASTWTVGSYFYPHNEHWSTLLMVWYKAGLSIFGARNYHVFMAGVLAVDAAVACLLFVLIRRRCGDVLAIAAAALLLGLGRGSDDILWAFQIGFTGAVAFGLVATLLVQGENLPAWRLALASGAMLCSLVSQGTGLFWWVLVAVDLLFSPPRRRYLWILVVPLLAYLVWFAAIGHATITGHRSPLSVEAFHELAGYVPTGIGAAIAGVFGLSVRWGEMALAGAAAAFGIIWFNRRWKVDTLVLGAIAGLVSQFVLTGLVRAQYGDTEAASSRYVWVAAVFVLLILADTARGLPWNRLTQGSLLLIVGVSLVLNGSFLHEQVLAKNYLFAKQDAELQVTWMLRQAPGLDRRARIDANLMPQVTAGGYVDSRQVLGSHLASIDPSGLASIDGAGVNIAFGNLLPIRATVVPAANSAGLGICTASNSLGVTEVQGQDKSHWLVMPSSAGPVSVMVWYAEPKSFAPTTTIVVGPGQSLEVVLPDTGLGLTWHFQVTVPSYLGASVCASSR